MLIEANRRGAVPAIELRHIEKRFGALHANRDVSLSVSPGSITGIVGENGAGKSTLMSILYGFYQADSGEILIDGKPVNIASSSTAIALGIGMVHQHFVLVDTFTVQRRRWNASRKAGLLSIPSALALMFAKPTLMSLAQNGTSPQRMTSKLRSLALVS